MVLDRFSTLVAAFFKKNEHCRLHVRGCKVPGSQSVVESMQPAKGALLLLEIRLARICLCCFSWHGWFCWRGRGAVATSVCAKMFGHWHICHGIFHGSLVAAVPARALGLGFGVGLARARFVVSLNSRFGVGSFLKGRTRKGGEGANQKVSIVMVVTRKGGAQPDWGETREYDLLRIRTGQKEPARPGSTIRYG